MKNILDLSIEAANGRIIPTLPTKLFLDETVFRVNALQRDHKRRAPKMRHIFDKMTPSQFRVSACIVPRRLTGVVEGEKIIIEPGIDKVDGHTRTEDWGAKLIEGNVESVPQQLVVDLYTVNTFKEYKELYDSFDSVDAVDGKAHKITGACRALQLSLNSSTAMAGGFASALSIAYPGNSKDALHQVAYFKDQIVQLDQIGLFDPEDKGLKFQCMMAAGLMALKLYQNPASDLARIMGGLNVLATAKSDQLNLSGTEWYGMDAIISEYLVNNKIVDEGELRKTNYAAVEKQMNFLMYCISKYMNKKTIKKGKGLKYANMEGVYKQMLDAMDNADPAA